MISSINPTRVAKVGAGAITLALALAACGSDGSSTPKGTPPKDGAKLSATLNDGVHGAQSVTYTLVGGHI